MIKATLAQVPVVAERLLQAELEAAALCAFVRGRISVCVALCIISI
jgi:hypothetical protein